MTSIWIVISVLAVLAGVRYLARIRSLRTPAVDDDAVRRILDTGSLEAEDDESLDLDEAARAEEEFWDESWDDPEEYGR
jgi:hypothetical protein